MYGCADIPPITSYLVFDENDIWNIHRVKYDESVIKHKDQETINKIVDMLSNYTATDLVRLTCNQIPWQDAYNNKIDNEITIDSLIHYFT